MRLISFFLLGLLTFAPLSAKTPANYLSPNQPDVLALLAPPPVNGSDEDRADLESSFAVASTATPAQLALAQDEDKLTIFQLTASAVPWLQPGKFPKTEALFTEIEAETKPVTSRGKKYWQRLRPYHVDPARFPHAIEHEKPTDFGYPSGHSTRGTLFAFLLAELFPAQREALLAKGREAGWLRVRGGVHYPTDIYAGRVLGQALAREFLASPEFQNDLADVRAELAAGAPR
ncbi:MAG: hypothetical protein JWM35_1685 [Verrucomicrobia bacterium]|nr:hypothetical protein [Verrucomicrobiota bacterium]